MIVPINILFINNYIIQNKDNKNKSLNIKQNLNMFLYKLVINLIY